MVVAALEAAGRGRVRETWSMTWAFANWRSRVLDNQPPHFGDDRGTFFEWLNAAAFEEMTGHRFATARPTVRSPGPEPCAVCISQVPPGRAKYVICTKGAVFDVVVDIRVGSHLRPLGTPQCSMTSTTTRCTWLRDSRMDSLRWRKIRRSCTCVPHRMHRTASTPSTPRSEHPESAGPSTPTNWCSRIATRLHRFRRSSPLRECCRRGARRRRSSRHFAGLPPASCVCRRAVTRICKYLVSLHRTPVEGH